MLATIGAALATHTSTLVAMALFAGAIIYYATKDMITAIMLFITYSALEGMFKYLNNWSSIVYAVKPALALAVFLIWALRSRKIRLPVKLRPPVAGLFALLILWGIIELFNPAGLGIADGVPTLWMWYVAPIVFYFLTYDAVLKRADGDSAKIVFNVEAFCYCGAVIGAIVAGFAVFQFAMGIDWTEAHLPGYSALHHPGWFVINSQGKTLQSSFCPASTTDLGGSGAEWANFGGMAALGLLFSSKVPVKNKIWLAACYFLDIAGIWVSGVRLFVILTLIQIPIFAVISATSRAALKRNITSLVALFVLIAGAVGVGQSFSNGIMLARYASTLLNPVGNLQKDRGSNLTYLPVELEAYPLGTGYHRGATDFAHRQDAGVIGASVLGLNRETQFNAIADDMGLPGAVILGFIFTGGLVWGARTVKWVRDPHDKVIACGLFTLFGGYVVACALIGPLVQGREYVWIILAMLTVMSRTSQPAAAKLGYGSPQPTGYRQAAS